MTTPLQKHLHLLSRGKGRKSALVVIRHPKTNTARRYLLLYRINGGQFRNGTVVVSQLQYRDLAIRRNTLFDFLQSWIYSLVYNVNIITNRKWRFLPKHRYYPDITDSFLITN